MAQPFTQFTPADEKKLFQQSVPSAHEETPIMSAMGRTVIHVKLRFLMNHSVAVRSVSEARSWFADAKSVQSCFAVAGLPMRSATASAQTIAVPTYMLRRKPFFAGISYCHEKRARRVPASTDVMRNAETESSMNDSATRCGMPTLTQNPAIVEANICTGSMPWIAET